MLITLGMKLNSVFNIVIVISNNNGHIVRVISNNNKK